MEHLFVYGTLAPGESNERFLQSIEGLWQSATARGHHYPSGTATTDGYPALRLDPYGPVVSGQLFSSSLLSTLWEELDAFEGDGYRRVLTRVNTMDGEELLAFVYEAK